MYSPILPSNSALDEGVVKYTPRLFSTRESPGTRSAYMAALVTKGSQETDLLHISTARNSKKQKENSGGKMWDETVEKVGPLNL